MLVSLDDLTNEQHVASEGALRYFVASHTVVCVGAYDAEYQICLIWFTKNGTLNVSAHYGPDSGGIVSRIEIPPGSRPPYTLRLSEHGKATSHLVKYAHKPEGRAHFSQDGKVYTRVVRQSFPLRSTVGQVFQLHAYWPSGFERFDLMGRDRKRVYVRNRFTGALPPAIVVAGEWRRKAEILANVDQPGRTVGPRAVTRRRSTGVEQTQFLLGQPAGFALRDHVLMVSVYATVSLPNIDRPTLIFLGGWDPHEVKEPGAEVAQTGCLSYMYPVDDLTSLERAIGSIDFVPLEAQ